jgi:hypothetical protein
MAVAALCLLVVMGCGGAAKSAKTRVEAVAKSIRPPRTVEARPFGSTIHGMLRPGTRVSRSFSGRRAFANRRDGFALGNLMAAEGGPMYPLATTDGGKVWRTAGPAVDLPVAQGGIAVAQAGVVGARTWFMCCGLNTVVDVTPDAGKHWWQAFLPGEVITVVAGTPSFAGPKARLVAIVRPFATVHSHQRLWIYVSTDGRLWRYDPKLAFIY